MERKRVLFVCLFVCNVATSVQCLILIKYEIDFIIILSTGGLDDLKDLF